MLRKVFLGLCSTLLFCWVMGAGPLCWILRDGLGPKAVDSSGWQAVNRFSRTFYWGPVAFALGLLTVLGCVWHLLSADSDSTPEDGR
jgi:hypothetical protein